MREGKKDPPGVLVSKEWLSLGIEFIFEESARNESKWQKQLLVAPIKLRLALEPYSNSALIFLETGTREGGRGFPHHGERGR